MACTSTMKNLPRVLLPVFSSLAITIAALSSANAEFEFKKDDHIVTIGNTLADRMQHDGWLETLIQSQHKDLGLIFRNQGFSGDQVAARPRNKGFTTPEDYLKLSEADVIFVMFGYNESFAGDAGLFPFAERRADFVEHGFACFELFSRRVQLRFAVRQLVP